MVPIIFRISKVSNGLSSFSLRLTYLQPLIYVNLCCQPTSFDFDHASEIGTLIFPAY